MIVQCRECKKDVSHEAKKCPHCGAKQPAISEKQQAIATVLAALIVLFITYSCNKNDEPLFDDKPHTQAFIPTNIPEPTPTPQEPITQLTPEKNLSDKPQSLSLNIPIKKWETDIKKEFSSLKLKPLKKEKQAPCSENQCTEQYNSGKNLSIIVQHNNGMIIDVSMISTGDGSFKSGADIILSQLALAKTLSPNTLKEARSNAIVKLMTDTVDGKKPSPVIIDHVQYILNIIPDLGVFFTASRSE